MKVLYVCNTDGALYKFRFPLLRELLSRNFEVMVVCSDTMHSDNYCKLLEDMSITVCRVDFDGRSMSLFKTIFLVLRLSKVLRDFKPDIVHSFTHKANVMNMLANFFSRSSSKNYATITGLGFAYTNNTLKAKLAKFCLNSLYKWGGRVFSKIFVQNTDDYKFMAETGIIPVSRLGQTDGSGFDVSEMLEIDQEISRQLRARLLDNYDNNVLLVLMPGRSLFEKGVREFYDAARDISKVSKRFAFVHIGEDVINPSVGWSAEKLASSPYVQYDGFRSDIREYLSVADVVVLPSYREGTPRVLIEALYEGKYIITTDAPGCRETVIDNWNGRLVEVGNYKDLVSKILEIESKSVPDVKQKAQNLFYAKYDSSHVVEISLHAYGLKD